jgi:hypothetical protein
MPAAFTAGILDALHNCFFNRVYTYLTVFTTFALESDATGDLGKQGIVPANAYVRTGMEVSTSLANKDAACSNYLTIVAFYAKTFGFAIPSVPGATNTFFMGKKLQIKFKHFFHLLCSAI